MSDGADNIRRVIVSYYEEYGYTHQEVATLAALDELVAENERLRDALRYITGRDVAGYEAHMRPEEVARAALVGDSE